MNEMTFDEAIEALQHAVYGEEVRYAIARALVLSMNTQQSVAGKENSSNKKTTLTGNENSDNFYPTTKAVADALSTKAPASTAYTFDSTTTNVMYDANNPKKIYTRAIVNGKNAFVLTTSDNYCQLAFCYDGTEYTRQLTSRDSTTYISWLVVKNENTNNKKSEINDSNRTSTDFYPSIKAVVDYLTANYIGNGNNTVSWANLAAAVQTVINGKESSSNKQSSITAVNKESTARYPSIKAVVDYLVANYEALSNKLTSQAGINSDSTDTEYPTAKAVFNFGADILTEVAGDLVLKENLSNKKTTITGYETSNQSYPTTKAVYDYGTTITNNIEDVKAYIGYTSGDILGLHADFENNVFTRLGAAAGLSAGSDFNAFPMYGQRRRVVVYPNGEILDNYSPEDVGESDTDVDVMVYQPKFYYKVVPLKLEKQSSGLGYHIRKANYYISSTPHAGFKLHPLFHDANGNEIDHVLFSAYEASYMWRRQVSTNGTDFRYVDSIFHDGVDTDTTIETTAVLKSLPGVKPISGQYKAMNKVNMENCALRKSPNWHLDTIQSVSANQLLMAIELGTFNTQTAIGMGIVNNATSGSNNCSSLTGSTSALGNVTGMASETIYDVAGTEIPFNTNGKLAVSYRGMENPWGNIWKHINGINIWGDGTMNGGQVYIADNFNFNEEVKGETTINNVHYKYSSAGFTVSNGGGYISAFGYGDEEFDWLFMPSETTGTNSLPVGDYSYVTANLNSSLNIPSNYRFTQLGGAWVNSDAAGGFLWSCTGTPGRWNYVIGGRLLYVPTATV